MVLLSVTLQKTVSIANLNVGTAAPFRLNVQNTGASDAWNTAITDVLPTGMCAFDPTSTVTARVFASDGATPVSNVLYTPAVWPQLHRRRPAGYPTNPQKRGSIK